LVDFINEVEEELRKDKYNVLLRRFGPYIIALIVMIVAATGYVEYNKAETQKQARAASASYEAAAQLAATGDLQGGIERFIALSELAPSGYAGLSLSRAAGLKVQLGDLAGAIGLFDRAAAAFERPVHKDLSALKAAYILMEQGRYDDVRARVAVLGADGAPYQDLAKELEAHALLKAGLVDEARIKLTYLSTVPGVLAGVKSRSSQALSLLKGQKPVPTPAAPDLDLPADLVPPAEPVGPDTPSPDTAPKDEK